MLSASTSMPCSSIARSRSDTCVTRLSSGRVGGAGAPSVIPTRAIASATAQCACTSTVLTRRPLTTTSRRRVCARTGAAARRSQPTNARPASAPVVVPRNSLRVVMVGPPFRRGRVSCRIMGRFLWPLAVVAALALGWAAAGVAGKTSAARETEQLKQQVSTLQARLHAREEITAARSSDAGGQPGTPSLRLLKDIVEKDSDVLLRRAAAVGLRQLQTPESLPVLENILANGGDDRFVRLSAAYGLAESGRTVGVTGLAQIFQESSADGRGREMAFRALVSLNDERALPFMRQVVASEAEPSYRLRAIQYLTAQGDRQSVATLQVLMQSPTEQASIRDAAAQAYRTLGGR